MQAFRFNSVKSNFPGNQSFSDLVIGFVFISVTIDKTSPLVDFDHQYNGFNIGVNGCTS